MSNLTYLTCSTIARLKNDKKKNTQVDLVNTFLFNRLMQKWPKSIFFLKKKRIGESSPRICVMKKILLLWATDMPNIMYVYVHNAHCLVSKIVDRTGHNPSFFCIHMPHTVPLLASFPTHLSPIGLGYAMPHHLQTRNSLTIFV